MTIKNRIRGIKAWVRKVKVLVRLPDELVEEHGEEDGEEDCDDGDGKDCPEAWVQSPVYHITVYRVLEHEVNGWKVKGQGFKSIKRMSLNGIGIWKPRLKTRVLRRFISKLLNFIGNWENYSIS